MDYGSSLNQCWIGDQQPYQLQNGEVTRKKDLQKFLGEKKEKLHGMWRMAGKAILASIKEWVAPGDAQIIEEPSTSPENQTNVKELFPYVFFWEFMALGLTLNVLS